jgi:hypothetical protein
MTNFENVQGWRLENLRLDFQSYGEFKGKHTAKITFQNRQSDAFTFTLSPEETQQYILLIKDKIVGGASMLGQRLLQSLSLLESPSEVKAIGEEIPHETV